MEMAYWAFGDGPRVLFVQGDSEGGDRPGGMPDRGKAWAV